MFEDKKNDGFIGSTNDCFLENRFSFFGKSITSNEMLFSLLNTLCSLPQEIFGNISPFKSINAPLGSKKRFQQALYILVLSLVMGMAGIGAGWAQEWPNACFNSNLTNWEAVTHIGPNAAAGTGGDCGGDVEVVTNATVYPGQAAPGTAPNSNGLLPMVPLGQTDAVQLFSGHGDAGPDDWARVCQTATVPTNGNTCLSFDLAAIFENYHYEDTVACGANDENGDAYLEVRVLLGNANCAAQPPNNAVLDDVIINWTYLVGSNQIRTSGIVGNGAGSYGAATGCTINPATYCSGNVQWGYWPWTQYELNLCEYAGQQITLEATMYDCNEGGHYGWGYIDCPAWTACAPPTVTLGKTNNPTGAVNEGQTITYTLTYDNTSATPDIGVTVSDMVPVGTTLVRNSQASTPNMPLTFVNGNQVGWDIGYLAAGATGTLSFKVVVTQSCVTIVNQGELSDLLQPCN